MERLVGLALSRYMAAYIKDFSSSQFRNWTLHNLEFKEDVIQNLVGIPPNFKLQKITCNQVYAKIPSLSMLGHDPIVLVADTICIELEEPEEIVQTHTPSAPQPVQAVNPSKQSQGFIDRIMDNIKFELKELRIKVKLRGKQSTISNQLAASSSSVTPNQGPTFELIVQDIAIKSTNKNWEVVDLKEVHTVDSSGQVLMYREIDIGRLTFSASSPNNSTVGSTKISSMTVVDQLPIRVRTQTKKAYFRGPTVNHMIDVDVMSDLNLHLHQKQFKTLQDVLDALFECMARAPTSSSTVPSQVDANVTQSRIEQQITEPPSISQDSSANVGTNNAQAASASSGSTSLWGRFASAIGSYGSYYYGSGESSSSTNNSTSNSNTTTPQNSTSNSKTETSDADLSSKLADSTLSEGEFDDDDDDDDEFRDAVAEIEPQALKDESQHEVSGTEDDITYSAYRLRIQKGQIQFYDYVLEQKGIAVLDFANLLCEFIPSILATRPMLCLDDSQATGNPWNDPQIASEQVKHMRASVAIGSYGMNQLDISPDRHPDYSFLLKRLSSADDNNGSPLSASTQSFSQQTLKLEYARFPDWSDSNRTRKEAMLKIDQVAIVADLRPWERLYSFFFGGSKGEKFAQYVQENLGQMLEAALSEQMHFKFHLKKPTFFLPPYASKYMEKPHLASKVLTIHTEDLEFKSAVMSHPFNPAFSDGLFVTNEYPCKESFDFTASDVNVEGGLNMASSTSLENSSEFNNINMSQSNTSLEAYKSNKSFLYPKTYDERDPMVLTERKMIVAVKGMYVDIQATPESSSERILQPFDITTQIVRREFQLRAGPDQPLHLPRWTPQLDGLVDLTPISIAFTPSQYSYLISVFSERLAWNPHRVTSEMKEAMKMEMLLEAAEKGVSNMTTQSIQVPVNDDPPLLMRIRVYVPKATMKLLERPEKLSGKEFKKSSGNSGNSDSSPIANPSFGSSNTATTNDQSSSRASSDFVINNRLGESSSSRPSSTSSLGLDGQPFPSSSNLLLQQSSDTTQYVVLAEMEFDQLCYILESHPDRSITKVSVPRFIVTSPYHEGSPFSKLISPLVEELQSEDSSSSSPSSAEVKKPNLIARIERMKEIESTSQDDSIDASYPTTPAGSRPQSTDYSARESADEEDEDDYNPVFDVRLDGMQICWIYTTLSQVQIFFTRGDIVPPEVLSKPSPYIPSLPKPIDLDSKEKSQSINSNDSQSKNATSSSLSNTGSANEPRKDDGNPNTASTSLGTDWAISMIQSELVVVETPNTPECVPMRLKEARIERRGLSLDENQITFAGNCRFFSEMWQKDVSSFTRASLTQPFNMQVTYVNSRNTITNNWSTNMEVFIDDLELSFNRKQLIMVQNILDNQLADIRDVSTKRSAEQEEAKKNANETLIPVSSTDPSSTNGNVNKPLIKVNLPIIQPPKERSSSPYKERAPSSKSSGSSDKLVGLLPPPPRDPPPNSNSSIHSNSSNNTPTSTGMSKSSSAPLVHGSTHNNQSTMDSIPINLPEFLPDTIVKALKNRFQIGAAKMNLTLLDTQDQPFAKIALKDFLYSTENWSDVWIMLIEGGDLSISSMKEAASESPYATLLQPRTDISDPLATNSKLDFKAIPIAETLMPVISELSGPLLPPDLQSRFKQQQQDLNHSMHGYEFSSPKQPYFLGNPQSSSSSSAPSSMLLPDFSRNKKNTMELDTLHDGSSKFNASPNSNSSGSASPPSDAAKRSSIGPEQSERSQRAAHSSSSASMNINAPTFPRKLSKHPSKPIESSFALATSLAESPMLSNFVLIPTPPTSAKLSSKRLNSNDQGRANSLQYYSPLPHQGISESVPTHQSMSNIPTDKNSSELTPLLSINALQSSSSTSLSCNDRSGMQQASSSDHVSVSLFGTSSSTALPFRTPSSKRSQHGAQSTVQTRFRTGSPFPASGRDPYALQFQQAPHSTRPSHKYGTNSNVTSAQPTLMMNSDITGAPMTSKSHLSTQANRATMMPHMPDVSAYSAIGAYSSASNLSSYVTLESSVAIDPDSDDENEFSPANRLPSLPALNAYGSFAPQTPSSKRPASNAPVELQNGKKFSLKFETINTDFQGIRENIADMWTSRWIVGFAPFDIVYNSEAYGQLQDFFALMAEHKNLRHRYQSFQSEVMRVYREQGGLLEQDDLERIQSNARMSQSQVANGVPHPTSSQQQQLIQQQRVALNIQIKGPRISIPQPLEEESKAQGKTLLSVVECSVDNIRVLNAANAKPKNDNKSQTKIFVTGTRVNMKTIEITDSVDAGEDGNKEDTNYNNEGSQSMVGLSSMMESAKKLNESSSYPSILIPLTVEKKKTALVLQSQELVKPVNVKISIELKPVSASGLPFMHVSCDVDLFAAMISIKRYQLLVELVNNYILSFFKRVTTSPTNIESMDPMYEMMNNGSSKKKDSNVSDSKSKDSIDAENSGKKKSSLDGNGKNNTNTNSPNDNSSSSTGSLAEIDKVLEINVKTINLTVISDYMAELELVYLHFTSLSATANIFSNAIDFTLASRLEILINNLNYMMPDKFVDDLNFVVKLRSEKGSKQSNPFSSTRGSLTSSSNSVGGNGEIRSSNNSVTRDSHTSSKGSSSYIKRTSSKKMKLSSSMSDLPASMDDHVDTMSKQAERDSVGSSSSYKPSSLKLSTPKKSSSSQKLSKSTTKIPKKHRKVDADNSRASPSGLSASQKTSKLVINGGDTDHEEDEFEDVIVHLDTNEDQSDSASDDSSSDQTDTDWTEGIEDEDDEEEWNTTTLDIAVLDQIKFTLTQELVKHLIELYQIYSAVQQQADAKSSSSSSTSNPNNAASSTIAASNEDKSLLHFQYLLANRTECSIKYWQIDTDDIRILQPGEETYFTFSNPYQLKRLQFELEGWDKIQQAFTPEEAGAMAYKLTRSVGGAVHKRDILVSVQPRGLKRFVEFVPTHNVVNDTDKPLILRVITKSDPLHPPHVLSSPTHHHSRRSTFLQEDPSSFTFSLFNQPGGSFLTKSHEEVISPLALHEAAMMGDSTSATEYIIAPHTTIPISSTETLITEYCVSFGDGSWEFSKLFSLEGMLAAKNETRSYMISGGNGSSESTTETLKIFRQVHNEERFLLASMTKEPFSQRTTADTGSTSRHDIEVLSNVVGVSMVTLHLAAPFSIDNLCVFPLDYYIPSMLPRRPKQLQTLPSATKTPNHSHSIQRNSRDTKGTVYQNGHSSSAAPSSSSSHSSSQPNAIGLYRDDEYEIADTVVQVLPPNSTTYFYFDTFLHRELCCRLTGYSHWSGRIQIERVQQSSLELYKSIEECMEGEKDDILISVFIYARHHGLARRLAFNTQFLLVNDTDMLLFVRQHNTLPSTQIAPRQMKPFSWVRGSSKNLTVNMGNTAWSPPIDISTDSYQRIEIKVPNVNVSYMFLMESHELDDYSRVVCWRAWLHIRNHTSHDLKFNFSGISRNKRRFRRRTDQNDDDEQVMLGFNDTHVLLSDDDDYDGQFIEDGDIDDPLTGASSVRNDKAGPIPLSAEGWVVIPKRSNTTSGLCPDMLGMSIANADHTGGSGNADNQAADPGISDTNSMEMSDPLSPRFPSSLSSPSIPQDPWSYIDIPTTESKSFSVPIRSNVNPKVYKAIDVNITKDEKGLYVTLTDNQDPPFIINNTTPFKIKIKRSLIEIEDFDASSTASLSSTSAIQNLFKGALKSSNSGGLKRSNGGGRKNKLSRFLADETQELFEIEPHASLNLFASANDVGIKDEDDYEYRVMLCLPDPPESSRPKHRRNQSGNAASMALGSLQPQQSVGPLATLVSPSTFASIPGHRRTPSAGFPLSSFASPPPLTGIIQPIGTLARVTGSTECADDGTPNLESVMETLSDVDESGMTIEFDMDMEIPSDPNAPKSPVIQRKRLTHLASPSTVQVTTPASSNSNSNPSPQKHQRRLTIMDMPSSSSASSQHQSQSSSGGHKRSHSRHLSGSAFQATIFANVDSDSHTPPLTTATSPRGSYLSPTNSSMNVFPTQNQGSTALTSSQLKLEKLLRKYISPDSDPWSAPFSLKSLNFLIEFLSKENTEAGNSGEGMEDGNLNSVRNQSGDDPTPPIRHDGTQVNGRITTIREAMDLDHSSKAIDDAPERLQPNYLQVSTQPQGKTKIVQISLPDLDEDQHDPSTAAATNTTPSGTLSPIRSDSPSTAFAATVALASSSNSNAQGPSFDDKTISGGTTKRRKQDHQKSNASSHVTRVMKLDILIPLLQVMMIDSTNAPYASVQMQKLQLEISQYSNMQHSIYMVIQDAEANTLSSSAEYPVLLGVDKRALHGAHPRILEFLVEWNVRAQRTFIEYIGLRVLPFVLQIDSEIIDGYPDLQELLSSLTGGSKPSTGSDLLESSNSANPVIEGVAQLPSSSTQPYLHPAVSAPSMVLLPPPPNRPAPSPPAASQGSIHLLPFLQHTLTSTSIIDYAAAGRRGLGESGDFGGGYFYSGSGDRELSDNNPGAPRNRRALQKLLEKYTNIQVDQFVAEKDLKQENYLYVGNLEIFPLVVTLSIGTNTKRWPVIAEAQLSLAAFSRTDLSERIGTLFSTLGSAYSNIVWAEIYQIVGNLDAIASPLQNVKKLTNGVSDFFALPLEGLVLDDTPGAYLIGLWYGTISLVLNFSDFLLTVLMQSCSTLSWLIQVMTLDEEYQKTKALVARQHPTNAIYGLGQGVREFGRGFYEGITGTVLLPLKGAKKTGVGGFFAGLGKAVIGFPLKPIGGIFDLFSKSFEGLLQSIGRGYLLQERSSALNSIRAQLPEAEMREQLQAFVAQRDQKVHIIDAARYLRHGRPLERYLVLTNHALYIINHAKLQFEDYSPKKIPVGLIRDLIVPVTPETQLVVRLHKGQLLWKQAHFLFIVPDRKHFTVKMAARFGIKSLEVSKLDKSIID